MKGRKRQTEKRYLKAAWLYIISTLRHCTSTGVTNVICQDFSNSLSLFMSGELERPHLTSPHPHHHYYTTSFMRPIHCESAITEKRESVRCRGDSAAFPSNLSKSNGFLCNLSSAPPREDTLTHCGHGASGCTLLQSSLPESVYRPLCLGMSTQPTLKLMMLQLNVNQQRSSKFVIQS